MPGDYIAEAGTSTTDRQCAPCGADETTTASNWTRCVPTYVDVAAGPNHVCGIRASDGFATCWGRISSKPPAEVAFDAITSGHSYTCGIRSGDKHVVCWGSNDAVATAPEGVAFDAISAGSHHACGVRSDDGNVQCWGSSVLGETSDAPVDVPFDAVAAGYSVSCGIRSSDGEAVCWGAEIDDMPTGVAFDAISLSRLYSRYACGIRRSDHALVCWGGDGSAVTDFPACHHRRRGVPLSPRSPVPR
ncbi:MAG: hypothetical protein ACOCXM_10195, partial [Myxococcota bacterium]